MSCDSAIILLCVLLKKKFHTSSASPVLSQFSPIQLCATLWTVARHAPLSMGFSRQEYWGGLSFPLLGDLPDSGIEPMSFKSPEFAGGFFTDNTTPVGKALFKILAMELRQWRREAEGEGEVAQSCPTLCHTKDCNLLGFSVHGILQARILEWVAISFSSGSS